MALTGYRKVFAVILFVLSQSHAGVTLTPGRLLSQYAHTVWHTQDGSLMGTPTSIAQTKDGYLWIGTKSGLVRFDGVRFLPWTPPDGTALPSSDITALLGGKDGSLWIGTKSGAARWQGSHLTLYPNARGYINTILEDHEGSFWITRSRASREASPVCRLSATARAQCFGPADGMPLLTAASLMEDAHGFLWIGNATTLVQWRPGFSKASVVPGLALRKDLSGVEGIIQASNETLWVGIGLPGPGLGLRQFKDGTWASVRSPGFDGSKLDVTVLASIRNTALIVGTQTQGIYSIRDGHADRFRAADGLSSDTVNSVFEDHEGNLWVATGRGLDCFSDRSVVPFASQQGLSADSVTSVFASSDGGVWAGNWSGLDHIQNGVVSSTRTGGRLPGTQVTSLLEEHPDKLWLGLDNGLWIHERSRFKQVHRQDGTRTGVIVALAKDVDGSIWAASVGRGKQLLHLRGGQVIDEITIPSSGPGAFIANPAGGISFGLSENRVATFKSGEMKVTSLTPAGRVGAVNGLEFNAQGWLLAATSNGIYGLRNGVVQSLSETNGLPCVSMNNMIRDLNGDLWFSASCGLIRISAKEMDRWWDDPETHITYTLLDGIDGVQTSRPPFQPSVSRSLDGQLWFANDISLQMIDPAHLSRIVDLAQVHIEQLTADRQTHPPVNGLRLPALQRELEIDYTAPSFTQPKRVLFRYKLEGHETDWQDPGTRRQAFYSDLPPGNYRFRVIASNSDGIWNEAGDALDFSIAPTFYQTLWFKLLCAVAGVISLWGLYALRINQTKLQFEQRLGGMIEERERIARELHDTLLQGFQGVILRFQAVLKLIPDHEPAHQMMEKVMNRADEVLLQGRQSVRDLRAEEGNGKELSESLAQYAKELSEHYDAVLSVGLLGSPKVINADVFIEVSRIAREAMFNASQHAEATAIEVEVAYELTTLRLVVRDDGKGIAPSILSTGRAGHWGLSGMRERARKINASLDIWSRPGAGTEVHLKIPSRLAHGVMATSHLREDLSCAAINHLEPYLNENDHNGSLSR